MKMLNKIVVAIQVMLCFGMSATALAAPGQSSQTMSSDANGGFEASQFKLDMILAKRGDAEAQYYLGTAYEEGRGTQKDLNQAFHWYSKAAQQNQPEAQYKVGYFYEHGLSVKRDMNKAMTWYKLATKSSHGTVRARLHRQAFAHRTENKDQASAAVEQDQAEKAKARKLAEERKQAEERRQAEERKLAKERRQLEERKRQRKLAQERARQEAAHKQQQLAIAQQNKHTVVSTTPTQNASKRVNIPDITDVVLENKWRSGSQPADYLPSSSTHCLRASGSEVVCFSDEKHRVINGRRVTYTTKSTLSGFKPDGTFQVRYYYNAIQMDKASDKGVSVDPNGLKLVQGWQEPELAMNCRTVDRVNLYCARGSFKLHYQH